MISARNGNGAPDAVVTGRARAAASETMPRIPIHDNSSTHGHGGIGSRARSARLT